MIGNLMLKHLQHQIIIDSHLSGTQTQLFEKYPELKKKAEKVLGNDLCYDLAVYQDNVPVST